MVDSRPASVTSSAPLDDRAGVAALAPQFDLAVTASTRRSAPPIGSLSPQGTPFGPTSKPLLSRPSSIQSQPARSPSLVAADFLAECESHNVAGRDFPSLALRPSVEIPSSMPQSQIFPQAHFQQQSPPQDQQQHEQHRQQSHQQQLQPLEQQQPNTSHSDFDPFGLAALDLGPPVFEPSYASLSSPHVSADPFRTSHPHLSDGAIPAPPHLSDAAISAPPPHLSDAPMSAPPPHLSNGSISVQPIPSPPPPSGSPPARSPTLSGNGTASPTRTGREQAHPTRCVLLRNIPPGIDDDDIRRLLQIHGPLRDLGAQQRSRGGRGSVLATYYDLRHARAAVRALDQAVHFGRRLDARFQCPSDAPLSGGGASSSGSMVSPNTGGSASSSPVSPCANQGTLVVFNLDNSTSAEDIRALFSTVGDVKEIRATPNKKHHKFVEFYDVRDAERAMRMLNKTEVAGKRIKIEISRPGGRASNVGRHTGGNVPKPHPGIQQHQQQQQPLPNHHHAQQRHNQNPLTHVQYQQEVVAFRNASPHHQGMDVQAASPHVPSSFLSSINHGLPATSQHVGFAQSREMGPFDSRTGVSAALPNIGLGSAGFEAAVHPLQPSSYDGAFANRLGNDEEGLVPIHPNNGFEVLSTAAGRMPSSVPDQRADLHQMYANHVADLNKFSGAPVIQKPGPRYAADSYIQALYNSPGSDDGGKMVSPNRHSPVSRSPFTSVKPDGASGDVTGVNLYKSSFGDEALASNFPTTHVVPGASNGQARKVAVPHQTVISPNGERGYAQKQTLSKGSGHAVSNQPSGTKQYFNQQQSQQQQQQSNSKYALDIRKVRSGEETRTALMIRNIPNKYNQKMLLSTLEEDHRGHFDFIYLPIDFKNKCNVGYAFINFTKPEYIEPFYNRFHGKKWGRFNSEKVCEITFARIQGRQQLIAHFQNSSLLLEDPKCRPVIFDSKGRQEEFPIGSHVRTRRGPSSRDAAHRACDGSPPYSPKHRGRN